MSDQFTHATVQRLSFYQTGAPGTGAHGVMANLMFRVTSEDLATHLKARSDYHYQRAKDKEKEIPRLEQIIADLQKTTDQLKEVTRDVKGLAAGAVTVTASNKLSQSYGFSPQADKLADQAELIEQQLEQLQRDVKEHSNKAAMFAWLSAHLFPGTYGLDWADLQMIELAK